MIVSKLIMHYIEFIILQYVNASIMTHIYLSCEDRHKNRYSVPREDLD